MALYSVNNQNAGSMQSLSTTYKSLLGAAAATGATTLRRGWLWEYEVGAADVPNATDCPILYDISVQTAAGTSSALTPTVPDIGGGDAAALLTYAANYTAEPTVTASSSLNFLPLNQRASQRVTFKDKASCIIIPAVNLKGIVQRAKSPNYASTVGCQWYVEE